MKTLIIEIESGYIKSIYAEEKQAILVVDYDLKHDNPEEEEAFKLMVKSINEHISENNLIKIY